jgi:hypothetical protein
MNRIGNTLSGDWCDGRLSGGGGGVGGGELLYQLLTSLAPQTHLMDGFRGLEAPPLGLGTLRIPLAATFAKLLVSILSK